MATLRTQEEKSAIVAHCLELERTGGDILAYLWSENYVTPRATWCNFQREWLGRKPYEFTDGKPKTKKERENMSRLVFTEEQKMEAVRIAIEGGSPYMYLKGLGAKNPSCVWMHIKSKLAPEILAKIPKHPTGWKAPKDEAPVVKVDGPIVIKASDVNDVIVEEPKKANITVPLMHSGKKAIGWQGDFGTYIHDVKHGYIDYESNDGEEISMPVDAWRNFLAEIREIGLLMGVEL